MTAAHRLRIERRLFEAVALVLAGCHPTPVQTPPPQPTTGDALEVAPPAPRPIEPAPAPDAPAVDPQRNPVAFCASYKATSKVDATTAKKSAFQMVALDAGWWDATRKVVLCRIVRESVPTTVTIMHTPTCCPRPGGGASNCPGPQQLQLPGVRVLLQEVAVRPDGSVDGASSLTWYERALNPPHRHNCGRRPEGMRLVDRGDHHACELGAQLAAMAELEAASVPAFERLACELAFHGAPAHLIRRAHTAIRDEIRHARIVAELAALHGAAPRAIEVAELPPRSLAAIAHENAVEGCVREAYGALVATHQAACAAPELRDAFAAIAADERRHAALAEDVHAWIAGRLTEADRDAVERARADASRELRAQLAEAPTNDALGLPAPERAVALFDAYFG